MSPGFPGSHDYHLVWDSFQQTLKHAGLDIRDKEEYGLIRTAVSEIFPYAVEQRAVVKRTQFIPIS